MTPPRFLPAIASHSLGRAHSHALPTKLAAAAAHGFVAIELFYEDLETLSRSLPSSHPAAPPGTAFPASTPTDEALLAAARYVHTLCLHHRLRIICLQPFMHYDGLCSPAAH